jgi:hypothetical protein
VRERFVVIDLHLPFRASNLHCHCQARSFAVSLGGGKDNEGVVATKESTLVDIVATATPASLSQLESLVSQLP